MSRDVDRCAFEDCERPVKPGAQICSECAEGKEPSELASLSPAEHEDRFLLELRSLMQSSGPKPDCLFFYTDTGEMVKP